LLVYWFARWLPTAPQSDQLPPRFSNKFQTFFFALAVISLAGVESRLIYLRLLTGSRLISGHFLMFSTIFSVFFITSLFAGVYCLAWMILFYKRIRRTQISQ